MHARIAGSMRKGMFWFVWAALVVGCSSPPKILTRINEPPRLRRVPKTTLVVEPYESTEREIPAGDPLLERAHQELVQAIEESQLFEEVTTKMPDTATPGLYTLHCKLVRAEIVPTTGWLPNFLLAMTIVGPFLDLKINEYVETDEFQVDLWKLSAEGKKTKVASHRYEVRTVGRVNFIQIVSDKKYSAFTDQMFLTGNKNFAVALLSDLEKDVTPTK